MASWVTQCHDQFEAPSQSTWRLDESHNLCKCFLCARSTNTDIHVMCNKCVVGCILLIEHHNSMYLINMFALYVLSYLWSH